MLTTKQSFEFYFDGEAATTPALLGSRFLFHAKASTKLLLQLHTEQEEGQEDASDFEVNQGLDYGLTLTSMYLTSFT